MNTDGNLAALARYEREQEAAELQTEYEEQAFIQNTEDLLTEVRELIESIKSYQTDYVSDDFVDDCISEVI